MALSRYYQGDGSFGQGSAAFLPGSSGYWGDTGGTGADPTMGYPADRYRIAAGQKPLYPATAGEDDTPVWDSQKAQWVGHKSGKPYNGKLPSGDFATNGIATRNGSNASQQPAIDPNDPNQRYKAVDITKQPDVAAEGSDLLKQFKDGADKTLKGFDDYVNDFKSAASGAISKERAATDVAPVTTALANAQNRYAGALDQNSGDYKALNENTAAAETGIVGRANSMLGDYDTALNNAENLAQQRVTGAVSRYGAGKNASAGGVNMGMGGDIASIAAQKSYEASLPYEQAKINKRYDILQNLDLPVQRDIASRETSRIAQFNPATAAQIYGSDQDTQIKIQSLKEAAGKQDWQTALQVLQIPQIAAQVRNQILAGDTSLLGALSQLQSQTHYQGLQDLLGVNVSQPQYFSPGNLGYPAPGGGGSRYSFPNSGGTATGTPGGGGLPASNAPVTVNPNGAPQGASQADYAYFLQTGAWPQQDPNFSNESYQSILGQFGNAQNSSRYSQGAGYTSGSQAWRGIRYDPATGMYIDANGKVVSGGYDPTQGNYNDAPVNPAVEGLA